MDNNIFQARGGKVAIVTDELLPYCSIEDAQLSLHGFREAVKFFIEFEKENLSKIAAGGVGYIDFRNQFFKTLSLLLNNSYSVPLYTTSLKLKTQ